jgi:hypothetical protein
MLLVKAPVQLALPDASGVGGGGVHCARAGPDTLRHRGARMHAAISQKLRVSALGFGLADPATQRTDATLLPERSDGDITRAPLSPLARKGTRIGRYRNQPDGWIRGGQSIVAKITLAHPKGPFVFSGRCALSAGEGFRHFWMSCAGRSHRPTKASAEQNRLPRRRDHTAAGHYGRLAAAGQTAEADCLRRAECNATR